MSLQSPHQNPGATTPLNGAQDALLNLCGPFAPSAFSPQFEVVSPESMSEAARDLLVHEKHMTVELERHYGKPVDVHVLEEQRHGQIYTRKVCLTTSGDGRIVEWGIVRMNFAFLSPQIQSEVLIKESPLGAILIRHQTHRRINPRYFLRFPAHSGVIDLFGAAGNDTPVYGRLGTIFCDEKPAIELLEIVVNTDTKES
jgi:hypothetical protein